VLHRRSGAGDTTYAQLKDHKQRKIEEKESHNGWKLAAVEVAVCLSNTHFISVEIEKRIL